ncbi:hypothetical protein CLIM01_09243 [Colletotrichum limetticola]|uniref:Uncharacterized protein n=1 Tax=Colletotrichum limetticola TaxID=1209924 RepID=A0ABQ9PPD4_9PEZI|nr:hypothetical protein CLIM01_09243 [Colletotrichum limetticola]
MLPYPATRWPSSERYRKVPLQQRRRQKATSNGASQPASQPAQPSNKFSPSPCQGPHQQQQQQQQQQKKKR